MIWSNIIKRLVDVGTAIKNYDMHLHPTLTGAIRDALLLYNLNHQVEVSARALKLGDHICLFDGKYGTGVVESIRDGLITIVRPYMVVNEDITTDSLIVYTGHERVSVYRDSERKYSLIEPRRERMEELRSGNFIV